MGEADCDFINAGLFAERLLDRASAQRAVQAPDASADAPPIRSPCRFLAPKARSGFGACGRSLHERVSLPKDEKGVGVVVGDEQHHEPASDLEEAATLT